MLANLGEAILHSTADKAIEDSQQALVISRETKNRSNETFVLAILGNALPCGQRSITSRLLRSTSRLSVSRVRSGAGARGGSSPGLRQDWQARQQPNLPSSSQAGSYLYQTIRGELITLEENLTRASSNQRRTPTARWPTCHRQGRYPKPNRSSACSKRKYFEYIRAIQQRTARSESSAHAGRGGARKRYREIAGSLASIGNRAWHFDGKEIPHPEEEQRLARLDADCGSRNAFRSFSRNLKLIWVSLPKLMAKAFALRESQGLMEDLRELGNGTVRSTHWLVKTSIA